MTKPAFGTPIRRLNNVGAGYWEYDYGRVVDHGTTTVARSSLPPEESILVQWWLPDMQKFGWTIRQRVDAIEILPQHYEFLWDAISS